MKALSCFAMPALVLTGMLIFTSCRKQVTEDALAPANVAATMNEAGCKPAVFGVWIETPLRQEYWRTLMQKWYDENGKLAYLKAHIGWDFDSYNDSSRVELHWGELTYPTPNQVILRDVLRNKEMMRVTVDNQNRPLASYFNSLGDPNQITYIDTSYYYYTGNRLDSILALGKLTPATGPGYFRKYKFFYDTWGNLVRVESGNYRLHLEYDYTKPVTDMMTVHQIDLQYKLLEYMELLDFPVHHRLRRATAGEYQAGLPYPYEVYPIRIWGYSEYEMQDNGLVYAFNDVAGYMWQKFYTGWMCDDAASQPTNRQHRDINSLDEFRMLYPDKE